MYGQSLNESDQLPTVAKPKAANPSGVFESIDNQNPSYGLEDGGICDFVDIEVDNPPADSDGGSPATLPRVDSADHLTLSFRGQVYVFDNVTTEKVQSVFLLLGGCEFPSGSQAYQNRTDLEYPVRCNDPQRAASLSRFRQKRKERCFEKKIRYNVRQEVALRMNRKKGQFTSSKNLAESVGWNAGEAEDSGLDEGPTETLCAHCCTSSKSTPMMRRGPAGPRTLCNACGLFWANKGMLRDLSKKLHENTSTPTEKDEYDESIFGTSMPRGTNHIPFSKSDNSALVAEQ